jgi:hypothetical protein
MNHNEELTDLMQQEINREQQPGIREKTLTAGLIKAMAIIKAYHEQNVYEYEYSVDGLRWQKLKNKNNLSLLLDMGFIVKRIKL